MRLKSIILSLLLIGLGNYCRAQSSNLNSLNISCSLEWQFIDSCLIYPNSIQVYNADNVLQIPEKDYFVKNNSIKLPCSSEDNNTYTLFYRCTNTLDLDKSEALLNSEDLLNSYKLIIEEEPYDRFKLLDNGKGLKSSGVFSRNIGVGNNQNLVLNSTFNLQMQGDIGDGIQLTAAISDANIPIQPEGNTQQLNEFDRIFIQFSKAQNTLLLGDFQQEAPAGYFLRYFKKMQGVQYQNTAIPFAKGELQMRASFGISKGKFARNIFNGEEGNQGPYRLNGAEGETFIIILANTEKVYLDGQLLERGFDNDYTIDYNAGTITFTPKQQITSERRLIIEFEYNDQSYLRSAYTVETAYKGKKWSVYGNLYAEQDGRSRLGEGPLSKEEQSVLAAAGDDLVKAAVPAIDTSTEQTNPIRYLLQDTIINGISENILTFSNSQDSELTYYTVFFSNVGQGQGRYAPLDIDANGIVYQYLGFDDQGNALGSHEPIRLLPLPQAKKMATIGMERPLGEDGFFKSELALSQFDRNKVSELDKADDLGWAWHTAVSKSLDIREKWILQIEGDHEFKQKHFNQINPYRAAEFNRNWSLNNSNLSILNEHLASANSSLRNPEKGLELKYGLNTLLREEQYKGWKQDAGFQLNNKGWLIQSNISSLNAKGLSEKSSFNRPTLNIGREFKKLQNIRLDINWFRENNEVKDLATDSLRSNSFKFEQSDITLSMPETQNFSWALTYQNRRDFQVIEGEMKQWKNAHTSGLETKLKNLKYTNLNASLNYRTFEDILEEVPSGEGQWMGKVNFGQQLLRGVFRFNSLYQLTAGQEQKVNFLYQAVNPGEGNFQHIDFNGDGIEQSTEFVPAATQDQATHIRVIVYTDEFIRTTNALYNQSLNINPKIIFVGKKGWKGMLGLLSLQSNLQLEQKVQNGQEEIFWHPLQQNILDEAIVNDRSNINTNVWINRGGQKIEFQASQTLVSSSNLLTTGLDSRVKKENILSLRWNLTNAISTKLSAAQGDRSSQLEFYEDRSFHVDTRRILQELSFFPSDKSRVQLSYSFEDFKDRELIEEVGRINKFDINSQWNSKQGLFEGRFTFSEVAYKGNPNSPIGFNLLNGLQQGTNLNWELGVNRKLNNSLRLGLRYTGRKNGEQRVIHNANIQFSAFF